MNKYRVGIVGATGMVGQRFVTLLSEHPWFEISCLAARISRSKIRLAAAFSLTLLVRMTIRL